MADLPSRKVKVGGRTITVFKATFVMSLQRSVAITNASTDALNGEYKNLDETVINYLHRLLYPSLVACSEGKLPTESEFLKLLEEDVDRWLGAASELNPDWFSLNRASNEEQEQQSKNDGKPS